MSTQKEGGRMTLKQALQAADQKINAVA
jgi:hypothetical protein